MGEHTTTAFTRREALRRLGVGSTVLVLPGLLAACEDGDGSASGTPATKAASDAEIESISWALTADPGVLRLDSATGGSADGWMVQGLGLEGLLYIGSDLKPQPLLAESWEAVSPTEYKFLIREGVTFWDGSSLTAEDAAFSLQRHLDPKIASYLSPWLVSVERAEVTGRGEVTLRMKEADPWIPYILPLIHITPKAFTEEMGSRLGKPAGDTVTTMGTGPFRYVSFSAENGVEVVRNEDYWGEKPRVARATIKSIQNPQTQQLAARSGEVDGLFLFDLQQSKQWDRLPGLQAIYTPGMRRIYLAFQVEKPPFDDIHVRRAFAHASNREAYVDAFLGGHAVPGGPTIVPPSQFIEPLATDEEVEQLYETLPNFPYDIEAAKAELAQSAYPDGFKATVEFPSHEGAAGKALVSLSESLKEIGIDLEVREVTQTKWGADFSADKNQGLYLATGSGAYPDPAQALVTQFSSDGVVKGGTNFANYVDPEVDKLLKEQAVETDPAKRFEVVKELLTITSEDVPYLPLWFPDITLALSDKYVYEGFHSLYYANRTFLAGIRAAA